MIIFLNGTFGVGKTSTAQQLVSQLPRSRFYDPEVVGSYLMRALPRSKRPSDFQDLWLWRRLTVLVPLLLRLTTRHTIVMPMTIWKRRYHREIVGGLRRWEPQLHHFTLTATPETLTARIQQSGEAVDWRLQHLQPCTTALTDAAFATHIATDQRTPAEVADLILAQLR